MVSLRCKRRNEQRQSLEERFTQETNGLTKRHGDLDWNSSTRAPVADRPLARPRAVTSARTYPREGRTRRPTSFLEAARFFATSPNHPRRRSARISCISASRLSRIARRNRLSSDDSQFSGFQLRVCHEATPDVAHKPRARWKASSCSILLIQPDNWPRMASCTLAHGAHRWSRRKEADAADVSAPGCKSMARAPRRGTKSATFDIWGARSRVRGGPRIDRRRRC